ncbi:12 kDa heat shock protein [[Candida] zeylanoides]|jgi:hypothetical protein
MSDFGRKPVSDKISESVKPDSEKSTLEQAKESVTGTADKIAAKGTPEDQKSFSQTLSDSVQQGHDDAKSAVNKDQATLADTASEYVEAAKEQVTNAANYVSEVITGATEGAKSAVEDTKK